MRAFTALLVALIAATAWGAVDEHTTFWATFDRSARPDYCVGDWSFALSGSPDLIQGRRGMALQLAPGKTLSYPAVDKINPQQGTIEFWLRWPTEPGQDPALNILNVQTDAGSYLRFNTVTGGRLGMAYNVGTGERQNWHRVEVPPPGWQPGEWHHVAGTWGNGVIELFLDGQSVSRAEGIVPLEGKLGQFTLGRGPLVIDELHISGVVRSAEEIRASALAEAAAVPPRYLTDLQPADSHQSLGPVGLDGETTIDDALLPLTIGSTAYARGVALRAPGWVEYALPEGVTTLSGWAGCSGFADDEARVIVAVLVDGAEKLVTSPLAPGEQPLELKVDLGAAHTLRLEARPVGDVPAVAVLADLMLLGEAGRRPLPFARQMSAEEMTLQRMRTEVARYRFDPGSTPAGYVIYAGHPVDAIDPDLAPLAERAPQSLLMKAAPGEYEAVQFTIFATRDLPELSVTCSGLQGPAPIAPEDVQVYLVRRGLQRKGYWMPRKPDNYEITSRFLFPARSFWLPAGNFKEVYVLAHVPADAAPGQYRGTITITPTGGQPNSIELRLEVFPIQLTDLRERRYGMYYTFRDMLDRPEALEAELADMAAHGCRMILPGTGVEFAKTDDGTITWSLDGIRATLDALRRHGGFGPVPFYDRVDRLGQLLGYPGINKDGTGEPLAEKQDLLEICRRAFADLRALGAEYPEFEICLTHMDEVFTRDRIARYLDLAEVVRKTTDLRLYITHHTEPQRWEQFMAQADPYIDLRCMNGHSLENWLRAGHSFAELGQMLQASGDEGWLYHNMRGSFFAPEWNRIINGVWMWQSPIRVHVPWKYYSFAGDPFDDTDADGYDFGYAFPDPDDPTRLISTLHWEAFREGIDDMRYLATLEGLIARAEEAGVDASEARAWLKELAAMLPQAPADIADITEESPLCVAMARRFSGADWDRVRWHTAAQIVALQEKLGH